MEDKLLYPNDWVRVTFYIQRVAGLEDINSGIYHRTSIDQRCLNRKKRLLDRVKGNLSRLEAYFGDEVRNEVLVLQGRRMHRQYTSMIDGLENQIKYIEGWIAQKPPF